MSCKSLRHPRQTLSTLKHGLALAGLLSFSCAQAEIVVTPVENPNRCPAAGLPDICAIASSQAVVAAGSANLADRVDLGLNGGSAGLTVRNAVLGVGPATPPGAGIVRGSIVAGADFNSQGTLVVDGGQVFMNSTPGAGLFAGLLPGSTGSVQVSNGGSINITKAPTAPVGSGLPSTTDPALHIARGPGTQGSVVLDGGIGDFGSPALGATFTTNGDVTIGREGVGSMSLLRHATASIGGTVFMGATLASGQASLFVGDSSTFTAGTILAGIKFVPGNSSYDPTLEHGSASIGVFAGGFGNPGGVLNATVILGEGGFLWGSGAVHGQVINLGGRVAPGQSPGTLTIDGDYTQDGGLIDIEVASASVFDHLDITGHALIRNTTIRFHFLDGFAPTAGQTFNFLNASDVLFQDNLFTVDGLQPGFLFNVGSDTPGSALIFSAVNDGIAVPLPGTLMLLLPALLLRPARRRTIACGAIDQKQCSGAGKERPVAAPI